MNLSLDDSAQFFFATQKKKNDELVVPIDSWNLHVRDNPQVKPEDVPNHVNAGAYVITEREWFDDLVKKLGYLFYAPIRLPKVDGGFWFAEKLVQKKKMPKHDIFDVGHRQPGSFRSKG